MTHTTSNLTDLWSSPTYQARVAELEAEGLTTSDAQGAADVEFGLILPGVERVVWIFRHVSTSTVNECRKCAGPVDVYGEDDLCASCVGNQEDRAAR